ncbi:MAG: hypothetical protein AAGF24_14315, partial [Cyanobacteria bacterium P01_H01_bin.121]
MSMPTNSNDALQTLASTLDRPMGTFGVQSSHGHSASVPISVYRELADELQTTQTTIRTLEAQNQLLREQYHQLQSDVEQVIQATQQLRQTAANHQAGAVWDSSPISTPAALLDSSSSAGQFQHVMPPLQAGEAANATPQRLTQERRSEEISGWWLAM